MSITHHPEDEVLVDYVGGRLPLAAGLVVAGHLEACATCRGMAAMLEAAAGELVIERLPDAGDVAPPSLAAALRRLDEPSQEEARRPAASQVHGVALPMAATAVGFKPWRCVAPGLHVAHSLAARTDGWRSFLLRVKAGGAAPAHGHRGEEFVVVLEGGYLDGGDAYRRGDFAWSRDGQPHRLEAMPNGSCVCLIATQAPLVWRGWARLLQPIVGI